MLLLLIQASVGATERPKILILGDSLSAGYRMDIRDSWTTLLQLKLDNLGYEYDVVNASISGDTTGSGLRRLPRALQVHQPEIVIVELGGNDGLRATALPTVRSNLLAIVRQSQQTDAKVIIAGIQIPPNYGEVYAEEFTELFFDVAGETNAPLIPFFLKNVALNRTMMQADNIHPTTEAQPLLLENTWETLLPLLSKPET